MRLKQKHFYYAELAKLLEAGFDIRNAVGVMLDTPLPAGQVAQLRGAVAELDEGKSIVEAFGGGVSDLERSIIGAGEKGGRLAQSFRHLADYFGLVAALRAEAVRSVIYPLFVLHLGIFVAVVPRALMAGGVPLSEIGLRLLMAFAGVYAVGALLVWLVRWLLAAAPRSVAIDTAFNWIPLVGKARRDMAMARFTRVYHAGVLAGMTPAETLGMAGNATQAALLRRASLPLAQAAREGEQVGPLMIAAGAFPGAFARSYATAEQSGSLDQDMARWSALFQKDAEDAARAVAAVLPKLLYFMILAFIVWQILSFFTGYYETINRLSEDY
jgi:type IV pilus assembly protein PilC